MYFRPTLLKGTISCGGYLCVLQLTDFRDPFGLWLPGDLRQVSSQSLRLPLPTCEYEACTPQRDTKAQKPAKSRRKYLLRKDAPCYSAWQVRHASGS